ncbi:MAG: alpha amylase N-terminal ig-like domain-containing protein [Candidatus Izemoplasmatales bacterium]
MNFFAYHEAKSKYAYLYDRYSLDLRIIVSENFANKIEVLYGDPFDYGRNENNPTIWEWKMDPASPSFMKKEATIDGIDHFFVRLKPSVKRVKYAFVINDQYLVSMRGIFDITLNPKLKTETFNYYNFPYMNEEDVFAAPSWVKDQIWYSIFPERFHSADNALQKENVLPWGVTDRYSNDLHFGGDLKGIIEKIPYLVEVGFTGIYMTPIFDSDSTHKYDIKDYFHIDPAFGDNSTFGELVEKAHNAGLKIMLDAVFNHCGFRHPYFQDVIEKGEDSPYYDCFYIIDKTKPIVHESYQLGEKFPREIAQQIRQDHSLLNYRTFAFSCGMPKMNTAHPLMKKHLLDVATFWIEKYHIDGWRLDVSNEVGHSFWRDFRKSVKQANSEAYIVGENWDDAYPWLLGDQYDAVMNYGFMFPMHHYFGKDKHVNAEEFIRHLNRVLTTYPKNVIEAMYNLVDSHDTTRILEICGNDFDLVKLPYVLMFSLPGSPSVYYGGEVGLSGKHDPDNRRCMLWGEDQNQEMLTFMKKLISLRKTEIDLKSSEVRFMQTDTDTLFVQKNKIYVILFNELNPREVNLPKEMKNRTYLDLFDNKKIKLNETLSLSKYQFMILKEM